MSKKIIQYGAEQDQGDVICVKCTWRDEDSSYPQELGLLYCSKKTQKWKWINVRGLDRTISEESEIVFKRPTFATKEMAGDFLLTTLDACETFRQTDPLPKDVCFYLNRRAEQLEKEEKELLDRLWWIRSDLRNMETFASRNQIEQIRWREEYGRGEKQAVQKLLELECPEGEVPFFSEAYLYEKFGKDYARTILSLVRGVVKYASPSHAEDI